MTMYRILQLSDIHIGGEYDGKFDCYGHLIAALRHYAINYECPDRVIVTGDVCDKGKKANDYVEVETAIETTLGINPDNITWLMGNHDDRHMMEVAYGEQFIREPVRVEYLSSREDARIPAVFVDTSMNNPDTLAIVDAMLEFTVRETPVCPFVVFTHKPLGMAYHRFMNSLNDLPAADHLSSVLNKLNVAHVFCGHHHNAATIVRKGQPVLHVAPAIQVQLDPYSKECNPSGNYPGYSIIGLSSAYGKDGHEFRCETETVFVEDWVAYTV